MNVSKVITKPRVEIIEKCKDPNTFIIPCIIDNNTFDNVMHDLGVSINLMPLFPSLSLAPLKTIGVEI